MKKKLFMLPVLLICLFATALSAFAEGAYGIEEDGLSILGNLSKMGVTDEQLNIDLKEVYFAISPFTSIKFFDNLNSMLAALNSGRIVAFCIDEYTADYLISRTGQYVKFRPSGLPVYNLNFSMLLKEEDAELCERIASTIREMKADGTLAALKKQYIDDCIAGKEPDAVKPEHFEGAATLTIVLTGDRPPMDYFSATGEAIGFNTALISETAKRLKVNIKLISVDTGARAVALKSKTNSVVFWAEAGDFNNREGSNSEDQPEHTFTTEPFLGCTEVYVTLPTSPLVQK